jgi:hypothetical protein
MLIMSFSTEADGSLPTVNCDEIGRATRCYVSAHDRTRVHDSRLIRGEKRCLVADYNGAISSGRIIASITWRCFDGYAVVMSNARVLSGLRQAAVDITASWPGCDWLQCEATLDNGEVYIQRFRVGVRDYPCFDVLPTTSGPLVLTATAN